MIHNELHASSLNLGSSIKAIKPTIAEAPQADPSQELDGSNAAFTTDLRYIQRDDLATNSQESTSSSSLSTQSWVDQGAKQVLGMYFDRDYSQEAGKVGKFDLDPNQSRLRSALDLGKAPFANDSQTIAEQYGFSSAIGGGTDSAEVDLFAKDESQEGEESKNSIDELGEDLRKEFDRVDKEMLEQSLEKTHQKKDLKEIRKELKEERKEDKKGLKEVKKDKSIVEQQEEQKPKKKAVMEEKKEEPPPPPPPPEKEERRNR